MKTKYLNIGLFLAVFAMLFTACETDRMTTPFSVAAASPRSLF